MHKKEILKNLQALPNIVEREKFMKANGVKFTYDSFYNLIVWAEDGVLEFTPRQWKGKIK